MHNSDHGLRVEAMAFRRKDFVLNFLWWLPLLVAVSVPLASPDRCSAQTTLNLAADSSSAIYENGDTVNLGNDSSGNGSKIIGNVDFSLSNAVVTKDLNYSITDASTITGLTKYSQAPNPLTLPGAANTLSYGDPNNNTGLSVDASTSFAALPGLSGVYDFNIHGDFSADTPRPTTNTPITPTILTLSGAATDTFVFNIYSSGSDGGLSFNNVTMVLTGGLLASNVIFNVLNGGSVSILDSTASGTFYTSSGNTDGDISVEDSNLTGALADWGGGGISIEGSTVAAEPFVASGPPISASPEMPTIMTAGLGVVLLVARSYFNRLRRTHWTSGRMRAA
jgi:hypothetical protein